MRGRAFSLIELVVVVAILGIAGAIALPMVSGSRDRYRSELAALRVAAELDAARRHAIATSSDVVVEFDEALDLITFTGMTARDGTRYQLDLASGEFGVDLLSVSFTGGPTLTFDGYGRPCCGGGLRIDSGDAASRVTVEAETGAVDVQ